MFREETEQKRLAAEFPKGTLADRAPSRKTCRMGRSSMLTLAGETLGEAARNNSQMALSLLLEAGVDPDDAAQQYDPGGGHGTCSPLYLAVVFGNTRIAEQLLEAKADTEWQHPQYETTALHVACRSGHRTAAKLLLDNGPPFPRRFVHPSRVPTHALSAALCGGKQRLRMRSGVGAQGDAARAWL